MKKIYRSSETGNFVSKETAEKNPKTTYGTTKVKRIKKKSKTK